jgi:hypothetical protein
MRSANSPSSRVREDVDRVLSGRRNVEPALRSGAITGAENEKEAGFIRVIGSAEAGAACLRVWTGEAWPESDYEMTKRWARARLSPFEPNGALEAWRHVVHALYRKRR